MDITGIILAGGRGSRLGFNKLDIMINRVPLFIDLAARLGHFCNEIIISTSGNNLEHIEPWIRILKDSKKIPDNPSFKIPVPKIVTDLAPGTTDANKRPEISGHNNTFFTGALKGIYSSLLAAANQYSIVIASDMPFISYKLLDMLSSRAIAESSNQKQDMLLIKNIKGFEMLCSVYSKKCTDYIEYNISKGIFKISSLLQLANSKIISQEELDNNGIDMLNFFNINTKKDYIDFKKRLKDMKRDIKTGGSYNFTELWQNLFYR